MLTTARVALILALFGAYPGIARAGEVVVVVSTSSPATVLSESQVADIFLGRTRVFPDGRRAQPIDLPEGSVPHAAFYAEFTGRTAAQLKAHWSKIIFTGRGQPPRQLADIAQVKKALAESAGAIAYLPSDAIDPTVRLVNIR